MIIIFIILYINFADKNVMKAYNYSGGQVTNGKESN